MVSQETGSLPRRKLLRTVLVPSEQPLLLPRTCVTLYNLLSLETPLLTEGATETSQEEEGC